MPSFNSPGGDQGIEKLSNSFVDTQLNPGGTQMCIDLDPEPLS